MGDASGQGVENILLHSLPFWPGQVEETTRRQRGSREEVNGTLVDAMREQGERVID